MKIKLATALIIGSSIILPAIADDIYRWTDPATGQPMSAPYLPPYPIKEKRVAGKLPNGNVIQVILDPNSPEIKAIFRRKQEEEAERKRIAEERVKEQAIREAEQKRIAEERVKEQAIREAEQKRVAEEQARAQARAQAAREALEAEQRRLAQEKAESERLIQEKKRQDKEILINNRAEWESFFSGPHQENKGQQKEKSGFPGSLISSLFEKINEAEEKVSVHPTRPQAGEGLGERTGNSAAYPSLTLSPVPGGEGTERLQEKEEKHLAQEKAQDEIKKVENKVLPHDPDSLVIKGVHLGMSPNEFKIALSKLEPGKQIVVEESNDKCYDECTICNNNEKIKRCGSVDYVFSKRRLVEFAFSKSSIFNIKDISEIDINQLVLRRFLWSGARYASFG